MGLAELQRCCHKRSASFLYLGALERYTFPENTSLFPVELFALYYVVLYLVSVISFYDIFYYLELLLSRTYQLKDQ
jgi:hypothetical protein